MMGPTKSYITMMDEAILAKSQGATKHDKFPLRPSSAAYCSRRLAHQLDEYLNHKEATIEQRKANIHRLLAFGNAVEDHLIDYMSLIPNYGVRFTQQLVECFRINDGKTIIEGSTDLVLWSSDDKCVADVKSVGDRFHGSWATKWQGMKSLYERLETQGLCTRIDEHGWWVPNASAFLDAVGEDSLVENITQVNLYLCSDFMQDRGITHGSILRYLKNTSECMEIRFAPDFALRDKVKNKYELIYKSISTGAGPEAVPQDHTLGSKACTFCPYKAKCWPGEDAFEAYKATWPNQPPTPKTAPQELEDLFDWYHLEELKVRDLEEIERKIVKEMFTKKLSRVKLNNGWIYELKQLKSPPRLVLRKVNK